MRIQIRTVSTNQRCCSLNISQLNDEVLVPVYEQVRHGVTPLPPRDLVPVYEQVSLVCARTG